MPISFPNRASAVARTHQYSAHILRPGTPQKQRKKNIKKIALHFPLDGKEKRMARGLNMEH